MMRILIGFGLLLIAEFAATAADSATSRIAPTASRNIIARDNCAHARMAFEAGHGRVAFMGGSITQMEGYRPIVSVWLQKQFPKTKFQFVNAGTSSTCSTTGAFRLSAQVLEPQVPDLFFVEFAVNDDQDAGHSRRDAIRGMEGIVRAVRLRSPQTDIVLTHFVNPGMLKIIQDGGTPISIAAHEAVAEHYGVSTIYLARELADQVKAKTMTWKEFGGTHPKKPGNSLCAALIADFLTTAWGNSSPLVKREIPAPIDSESYFGGHFLGPEAAANTDWIWAVPDWKALRGGFRDTFAGMKLLSAMRNGADASLTFVGRAIGVYVLAGPDAGIVAASVDNGPFVEVNLFHRYSRGLHYPRTVMLATDLSPGEHTMRLRLLGDDKAARILQFTVNK
jgi:lysophospholipase L1-like esterase